MVISPTVPLTCTVNTLCHVDYKTPISVYKSTDYRTSTGTYHRFMPPVPQDFDARVKANINPKLLQSEPKQKEDQYKTVYAVEYTKKEVGGDAEYVPRPIPLRNVDYMRTMQEKMFAEPPPPIAPEISETHDKYYEKSANISEREVYPPNNFAYCEIKALGRDEQPPIKPEKGGYYKLMDPYMTTSRLSYVPFTIDQQDGISRKDIITFYDASGFPRGGKGYGPKNCTEVEPIFRTQIGIMTDRTVFKTKAYNKIIPKFMKRIPNYGMQSEYQGKYTMQTYFDSYPTIHSTIEDFDESLPQAGPWQTLIAPGMYCTDYCHIGTGWPVRSVVEPKKPEKYIERDIELCRNEQYVCE